MQYDSIDILIPFPIVYLGYMQVTDIKLTNRTYTNARRSACITMPRHTNIQLASYKLINKKTN
jgi:hypothetical protein